MNDLTRKKDVPIVMTEGGMNGPSKSEKKKTAQILEFFGIEAGIVLVVLVLVLTILNYFNVLPLSKNMPNIFGWLPHRSISTVGSQISKGQDQAQSGNTKESTKLPPEQEKFLITCPVSPGFCAEGKSVYNKTTRRIEGLGYIALGQGLAVYSVFDGTIDSKTEKVGGKNKTTIKLTGENGFVATYAFEGVPRREKGATGNKVKQSEIIGITDGGQLVLFDFTSQTYALSLSVVNSENNQNISVIPREDGRALDLK